MQKLGLYMIGFLEGLALMVFQLILSRILAAGFGTTLNVWAVIISATLLGLGMGYLYGSKLSKKPENLLFQLKIYWGIAFLLLLFLIFIEKFILQISLNLPGISAILLFALFGITPISFLMGTITPMIVTRLEKYEKTNLGAISGKLYANSTFGGIVGTFLFGLVLIPEHGLWISSIVLSVLVGISYLTLFFYEN
jgi:hypothetical protein